MAKQSFSYLANLFVPWQHRGLIFSLIQREISSRYRSSLMGLAWLVFNPLFTLFVYTTVFTKIFAARWPGSGESPMEFALLVFVGMTVFGFFSECVIRAPALVVSNGNYVKKIIFPLEILSWVNVGSAGFHMMVSFSVWIVFYGLMVGVPPLSCLLYPIVLLPMFLYTLGFSWILSALGVYFRDTGHIMGALMLPLMFLTPVFYPVSALPPELHQLMRLNPLAQVVEDARLVLFWGGRPDFIEWSTSIALSGAFAVLGLWFFQRSREGFADVL